MKKAKKTYGVYNLIEWHARLRMGKATVKVAFTGGSITTQGVTPATFTTENPVIQFAIENSPEFHNGKIRVVRSVKLNGVVEIECNVPKVAHDVPSPIPAPITIESVAAPVENGDNDSDMQTDNEAKAEDSVKTTSATTQVEFSCNDDAKDYLEQTFGLVRSKLRNREDIVAAGKAHDVEIIFI
ncbi:hypothetical protein [Muribaculum intestinale]|uniref:hypothetical protein n=1 Tax=Muribaculum intestinale TaxID=1796646 RepID=UPI0025A9DE5A|nr:hypothetical protein [Muribaculum intestinale]